MSLLEFRGRLRYPSGFEIDAAFNSDAPVTALFGPSGSGKTSILSMIAGLRQPQEGYIRVGKQVFLDTARNVRLTPEARHVGYVFQQHLLFPHLNVQSNLLYGWRRRPQGPQGLSVERVIQALELGELLHRLPHTLSGGQAQRVALGRALLSSPQLFLLDEPLASIEDELKERVLTFTRTVLSETGMPAIFVAHDRDDVRGLAQYVVEMKAGHVVTMKPVADFPQMAISPG